MNIAKKQSAYLWLVQTEFLTVDIKEIYLNKKILFKQTFSA